MRKIWCIVLLLAAISGIKAQKIVSVNGEYTFYAPSTMSLQAAKDEAVLQTKLHVLAEQFGTMVSATTTVIVQNSEGKDARSRSDVSTLATNEVKGEWIEDTKAPQQTILYDEKMPNTTIIHTKVWGKAREIIGAKADLDIRLLKETHKEATADVFKNEQGFYLYFQSPVTGYVAVYLLDTDEDMAYCLLPAADSKAGSVKVESNKEYIFFDGDPEYMFTTERSVIYNHLSVVFSPNEFYKANDTQGKDDNYTLPRELPLKQFQQWLVRCKSHDPQLQEQRLPVKIVK